MAQRVRKSYRGRQCPSSATQLPILAALHAGLPTLFAINIHDSHGNVKTQMEIFSNIPGKLEVGVAPLAPPLGELDAKRTEGVSYRSKEQGG